MMNKKKTIKIVNDEQLQHCLNFKYAVQAWVQGAFDKRGVIEFFDNEIVKIGGDYYVRSQCSFYIDKVMFLVIVGGK